jgi:hypothetical protein
MNERIQELAEQATKVTEPDDPDYRHEHFDKAKFAELIIKECIKVVDIWCDEVPCSDGYDKFTVSKLKERFGVSDAT